MSAVTNLEVPGRAASSETSWLGSAAARNTSVSRSLEQGQEIRAPSPAPVESAMQNQTSTSDKAHIDAGDGVQRTETQARGGVRRGVIKVLVASTLLAVIAMAAVWYLSARSSAPPASPPAATTATQTSQPNALESGAWDRRHLGANGLLKCQAFRLVLKHTTEAQASEGGSISSGQANRLQTELKAAKQMPPASVTPFQCGVPL